MFEEIGILNHVARCGAEERASFLAAIGAEELLEMPLPRLERHGMSATLIAGFGNRSRRSVSEAYSPPKRSW